MERKRSFADDLNQNEGSSEDKGERSDMNQYESLQDKWNDIQDAYLKKYPKLDTEELYFGGGGFEGLLEKISEIRGIKVEEVRREIEKW